MIARENILGIGVSPIDMEMALTTLREWIEGGQRNYVCVTGVHGIMESRRSAAVRAIHNGAGMVTPDGMPLVWLLKLAGHAHVDRVYGPDLMLAVFGAPSFSGCRHFFYGTTETTLERLTGRLTTRFPHALLVGSIAPPFRSLTLEEDEAIVARINAAAPDIVWVGLSTPKQERWMADHRDRLTAPVLIGVGAAFDIHAGTIPQAPKVLQRSGLEWAFRLCCDPRRLWRRYLVNNPLFLATLLAQKTRLKRFELQDSPRRAVPVIASESPYAQRLRKEARVAILANALSVLSPRLPRRLLATPARIGILAQWGIGDAVLLLPLLRGLKNAFPKASLEVIGKPWLSELFAGEGCADEFHTLVPPWTAYENKYRQPVSVWARYGGELRALRQRKLDWLISLRFDPRENLELRMLRARNTFGFSRAGGRFWLTQPMRLDRSSYDAQHRAAVSAEVAQVLTGMRPAAEPIFRQDPTAEADIRRWLGSQGYRGGIILAVHSGAGHPLRRWREVYFESVLKALSDPPSFIILIEDDEPRLGTVPPLPAPYAVWRGNLRALKSLLSVCDVFLGVDSGIMHMAAAARCKVVAAFGPGEPRWFQPSGSGHAIAVVEPMTCRPCFDACIHTRPLCLDRLDQAELASALDRQIGQVRKNGHTRVADNPITRDQSILAPQ